MQTVRMAQTKEWLARPRFWLIQTGGWLAYGVVSALGALPYRNAFPVLLYFLGTSVAAFFASLLMLWLCRRLMVRGAGWLATILVLGASSYGLGIGCSSVGAALEFLYSGAPATASAWRSVALVGFANAFAPSIMLIAWSALYRAALHWQEANRQERELLAAVALAREAELKALRYQITPHFLFNTLNGISTLVGEEKTQDARRMISLLADFLRSTLEPSSDGDVTMAQELAQALQYIEIEQIRLGQRLSTHIECDPAARAALIPHLLLQPLVENAIRHGIAGRFDGGTLSVAVGVEGGRVRISMFNSADARSDSVARYGLGIANTSSRLAARYREDFRFSSASEGEGGWRTTIDVPLLLTESVGAP